MRMNRTATKTKLREDLFRETVRLMCTMKNGRENSNASEQVAAEDGVRTGVLDAAVAACRLLANSKHTCHAEKSCVKLSPERYVKAYISCRCRCESPS